MPFELKKTINLPQTAFPMKANLPQNEPKTLERWEQMGIYQRIREARQGAPRYILHDGPPYTSGPIHMGTALNKCLKDFIVKSKTMAGFDAPYVPGWDCHGLPIEIKVDKELGGKKLQMAPSAVRAACRKYAEKYLDLQRKQFKRIGVFGRFERPYATMTPQYESVVLSTFFSFYENGFVYKGLRAVYWCMHDETALAEAEVEYENHTSSTVWVKYRLLDDPSVIDAALAGKAVSTIIWTTTPWTLPASMAVAFHPDEEYVALESRGEVFIVASKLAEEVSAKCNLADPNPLAQFPGRKLERLNFQHPFLDRKVLGVLADYVTMDTGTGVVHTAPSHGAEDFMTGMKYGLDATSNVDEKGILRNGLPEYTGKRVWDANQPIIDLVRSRGALLHTEKTEHSYPHCWRCHNPVIFRATEQWFISMETPMPGGAGKNDTLRSRTLQEIRKVKWDPAWGEERLSNMIETRPDWCISRQRVWGVPIAVFLCGDCGKPLNDKTSESKQWWNCLPGPAPTPGSLLNLTTFCQPAQSVLTAGARNSRRRRIFSTYGWSRAQAISRWWPTNLTIHGLQICISKAVISTAVGSNLPCSAPWARTRRLRIKALLLPAGRSTRRAKPCPSRVATMSIRWTSPAAWAEKWSGSGWPRSISAKTSSALRRSCSALARIIGKSETNSSKMRWEICTISIRRKTRCRLTKWIRSTSTCCGRRGRLPGMCANGMTTLPSTRFITG